MKRTISVVESGTKRAKTAPYKSATYRKVQSVPRAPFAAKKINHVPDANAPEVKFLNVPISQTINTIGTADAGTVLNQSAQGLDNFNRVGRRIQCISIQFNVAFQLAVAATHDIVRWTIAWVNGNQGLSVPTSADVYNSGTAGNYVYQGRNMNNINEITVLRSGRIALSNITAGGDTRGETALLELFIPLKNVTNYNTTGSAIPSTGVLVFYVNGMQTANFTTVVGDARVRFTDA